jgi:hypothetical protein
VPYSLVMHLLVRTSAPSCVSLHVLVIVSTARMTVSMLAFVLIDCCNWCMCLSLSNRDRRLFTRRFMAQSQLDTRKPFCTAAVALWTVTGSCYNINKRIVPPAATSTAAATAPTQLTQLHLTRYANRHCSVLCQRNFECAVAMLFGYSRVALCSTI